MSFRLPNPTILILASLVLVAALLVAKQRFGQSQPTQLSSPSQSAVQPPPPGSPAPVDIFRQAIAVLESRRSIRARVRQNNDIFGRRPFGSGTYLEQRLPDVTLFRLEMKLELDDQQNNESLLSSLLQVCDGHHVWNYCHILKQENETLTRIDLDRVNHYLQETGKWQPGNMGSMPGIGGLPRMMQAIGSNFDFTRADQTLLHSPGVRSQVWAWRLEGLWTPARLAQLLPEQAKSIQGGKTPNLSNLPKQVPDRVVVFLGMDDLFPYRIEYRRQPDKKESPEATSDKIMTEIDFYDVAFDELIPSNEFLYNPGKIECKDETDQFLSAMGVGAK